MTWPSMGPKSFWTVQIILDGSNSFWTGTNYKILFRKVQFEPEQNDLDPTKIICTQPKQFAPIQKKNGLSKIILDL